MRSAFLLSVVLGALGCSLPEDRFECAASAECADGERAGTCEPEGVCSFPDDSCSSGDRFGDSAGDLAGLCTSTGSEGSGTASDATIEIVSPLTGARWSRTPAVQVEVSGSGLHHIDLFGGPPTGELQSLGEISGDSGSVQLWPELDEDTELLVRAVGYTTTGDEISDEIHIYYRFGSVDAVEDGLAQLMSGFAADKNSPYQVGETIDFSGTIDGSATSEDGFVLLSRNSDGTLAWLTPLGGEIDFDVSGTAFEMPPKGAGYRFIVEPPRGENQVRVFFVSGGLETLPAIDDLTGPRAVERATRRVLRNVERWDYADTYFAID